MADTPIGETATTSEPKNEGTTTSAPITDNTSNADVEQAKREAEQARMRANQLENELKAVREKQLEAERKQLEEKEEYKTLFEKTDAELKAIREAQEASQRQLELSKATEDVFKDYDPAVVKIAQTTGLGLTDDSEDAKKSLTDKLNAIKETVGPQTPVTSNNPSSSAPTTQTSEALGRPKQIGVDDGGTAITDGSQKKVMDYIGGLSAVERMRRDAGVTQ